MARKHKARATAEEAQHSEPPQAESQPESISAPVSDSASPAELQAALAAAQQEIQSLRQELAKRDAEIAELRAGKGPAQASSDDVTQLQDKWVRRGFLVQVQRCG